MVYVVRIPDNRWANHVLMRGEGKEIRGRLLKNWIKLCKEDLRASGIVNWSERAKDRRGSRKAEEQLEAMSLQGLEC